LEIVKDLEIEKILLGGCFRSPQHRDDILRQLTEEDFASELHQQAFLGIRSLHERGAPVDLISLSRELENQGAKIPASMIVEIVDEFSMGFEISFYIGKLRELTCRRKLMEAFYSGLEEVADLSVNWGDLRTKIDRRIRPLLDETLRGSHRFRLVSAQELLMHQGETARWLWDEILPQGGSSLMVAKPKVGKSTLALNLSLAVTRGDCFLGRATMPSAVIYLALEEKEAEVQRKLQALRLKDEPLHFHFGLAPSRATEQIDNLLAATGAGLLVVDTLQKLARIKDLNDYAQVSRALEVPLAVARARNCHILLVHHAGKTDRSDGDEILGSTALLGAVDTALFLKKRDQGRTLSTLQRYGDDLGELLVLLQEDGSLITGGSLAEVKRADVWAEIENVLKDRSEMTTEEIREATDRRKAEVIFALKWAYEMGRISRQGTGRRGDAFRYSLQSFCSAVPAIYMGMAGTETKNELSARKDLTYSVPENCGSQAETEQNSLDLGTETERLRFPDQILLPPDDQERAIPPPPTFLPKKREIKLKDVII